jgi:nitrogen regulatory protein P-II 1
MKLITAIIQPEKLDDVKAALLKAEINKMTVSVVHGCGQQAGYTESYRGSIIEVNLLKKVQIEIAVNDDYVDATVDAIISAARTGKIGDGKIFVRQLDDCIRIRTGEKGKDAIG